MTTVRVDVEVELDEFSDEDLETELASRGYTVFRSGVFPERVSIECLRLAVLEGRSADVYEMAAQIAGCAHLLPPYIK